MSSGEGGQKVVLGTEQYSGFRVDPGEDSAGILSLFSEFVRHGKDNVVGTVFHDCLKLRMDSDQVRNLGVRHGVHIS